MTGTTLDRQRIVRKSSVTKNILLAGEHRNILP